jgi:hypothetical protein
VIAVVHKGLRSEEIHGNMQKVLLDTRHQEFVNRSLGTGRSLEAHAQATKYMEPEHLDTSCHARDLSLDSAIRSQTTQRRLFSKPLNHR